MSPTQLKVLLSHRGEQVYLVSLVSLVSMKELSSNAFTSIHMAWLKRSQALQARWYPESPSTSPCTSSC